MHPELKIWKPGTDLTTLLHHDGDITHFGGLAELRYFVDYLGAIPVSGASELASEDIVLVSNSSPQFHEQAANLRTKKIIQIVSDLNLVIPDEILGEHFKICQIPQPIYANWYYGSIEKALLLFQDLRYGENKEYTLVYGGGTRNGNRDEQYLSYLNPSNAYVSAVYTSSGIFPESPKVHAKVTFNELQRIYAQTKYGIVISDPQYYETGMLTQRYWEYCLNGMVAFVDNRYDKFNATVDKDDFVRVQDSAELQEKIDYLEAHPEERKQILAKQAEAIETQVAFMKNENVSLLSHLIFDIY